MEFGLMWETLVAINLRFGYSLEHHNGDDLGMIYDIGVYHINI